MSDQIEVGDRFTIRCDGHDHEGKEVLVKEVVTRRSVEVRVAFAGGECWVCPGELAHKKETAVSEVKFIKGDVIDIGTTRENPIRECWGLSPNGGVVWHSKEGSPGGNHSLARQCRLVARYGLRVGQEIEWFKIPGPRTITELQEQGVLANTDAAGSCYIRYSEISPYIAPPEPTKAKWEAKCVLSSHLGSGTVIHRDGKPVGSFRCEGFQEITDKVVAFLNAQEAAGPGVVAVGRRVKDIGYGLTGIVLCIEDGEACYRWDRNGGLLTAMVDSLIVIDDQGAQSPAP